MVRSNTNEKDPNARTAAMKKSGRRHPLAPGTSRAVRCGGSRRGGGAGEVAAAEDSRPGAGRGLPPPVAALRAPVRRGPLSGREGGGGHRARANNCWFRRQTHSQKPRTSPSWSCPPAGKTSLPNILLVPQILSRKPKRTRWKKYFCRGAFLHSTITLPL